MPEDKCIVFHDGYRLEAWIDFFRRNNMKNVYVDAHIYIFHMESYVKIHDIRSYRAFILLQKYRLKLMQSKVKIIVGEWCISNAYANDYSGEPGMSLDQISTERKRRYLDVAALQLDAWKVTSGDIYWSYKFDGDADVPLDSHWKESWDYRRCRINGWLPAIRVRDR